MAKIECNDRWKIGWTRDAKDSLSLRYGVYNLSEQTDRFLVFLNGRSEYIEKYQIAFEELQLPPNCALLTWDHRGQGDSGGARGFVESYDCFVEDAKVILDLVVGDRPYMLMAHSMGSLISLYGTLKQVFHSQKMLFLSPLLGLPNHPVHTLVSRPLAHLMTGLKLGPVEVGTVSNHQKPFAVNLLTHSISKFSMMKQQPYHIPKPTFGWLNATFQALDVVYEKERLIKLNTPILILGGTEDQLINSDAWPQWASLASGLSASEIQFAWIHGAKHEMLIEIPVIYQKVLLKIKSFISDFVD